MDDCGVWVSRLALTKVEKSISEKLTRDKSREEGKKGQGGQALGGLASGGTEDREGPVC